MSRRDERRAKHDRVRWSNEQRKRRRELGQNFLKDKRVARWVVTEAGVGKGDFVVELGAGGGMLTHQLARAALRVVAVEYDPYWAEQLRECFSEDDNVRVVQGDALTVGLPKEPFVVVANVPFNLTTPILHRLLDDPTAPLRAAHLLVQKQVALKHARSTPTTLKTLNWSPWHTFSAGLELPADVFRPKPQVDVCLMVAAKRGPPLVAPEHRHLFRAFVRRAFEGPGNSVRRTLRPFFTKPQLRGLARANEFSLDCFPSMLTVHQWATVFDSMILMTSRDRWPSPRRQVKRESRRR
ncbi:MAG: 23S ribosomal RNA methyltransferase Erm [Actinomycetota bacterium]|nr:23S ribosomal RNA methyltransferase Erm [Actinomycetota bacterium]